MTATHEGRVALITGASSGIGMEFARLLAAAGAKVVLAARRTDRLDAVVAEIGAAGGEALAVAMDVADEASIIAGYDAAQVRFGLVDTVIANAGVNVEGPAVDITAADYDRIQAVNTRGVFLTAREAGRRLLAAGEAASRGRIVVLASMGGVTPLTGLVSYCGSKAGAVMLGRGLAKEWARAGICVNVVCPGYMLTEINRDWFTSPAGERMIARLPRQRLMPIAAILPTIAHLTSGASAFVTGAVIQIDDGQEI